MKYIKALGSHQFLVTMLRKYNIKNYTINPDETIDVDGNVNLGNGRAMLNGKIPFKFNIVTGDFYCYNSGLNSLKGSPKKVGGMFLCGENNLVDLVGGPETVGHEFNCHSNKITSLIGGPEEVGDNYICSGNEISSLEGCALEINGELLCENNNLTNLDTVSNINGNIYCYGNSIDPNNNGFMGWCGGKIIYTKQ